MIKPFLIHVGEGDTSLIKEINVYYMKVNVIHYGTNKLYIAYFHKNNEIKRVFQLSERTFKNLKLSNNNTIKAFHLLGFDLDICVYIGNTNDTKEAIAILGIKEDSALKVAKKKLKNLTKLQYKGYNEDTLEEIYSEGGKAKNTLYLMPLTRHYALNERLCANIFFNENEKKILLHEIEACDSYLDDYDIESSLINEENYRIEAAA